MSRLLPADQVQSIVRNIATTTIGAGNFTVVPPPAETTDFDGDLALDITVVLTSESVASTMPVLEMLFLVRKELLSEGDQRFPFIHYTTEGEMASSEDDES